MRTKCPVCNSCLNAVWVANRRFFNCWLCSATYDIVENSLKKVTEIVTAPDFSTTAARDVVVNILYEE